MSDYRKSTVKYQRMNPHERLVKLQVVMYARSSFTQKGPGVTANLRDLLDKMDQADREIMHRRGWDCGLLRKTRSGKLRY